MSPLVRLARQSYPRYPTLFLFAKRPPTPRVRRGEGVRHPGDKTQAATANSARASRGRRGFAGRRDAARELRRGGAALRERDGGGRRELRARTREVAHREPKSMQRPADSDLQPGSSSSPRRRPHLGLQCSGLVQLQSNPCSCISFYFFLSERESGSNMNHLIYPYHY